MPSDSELVKQLLTLDLKATTAKILETCRTHIAIADNLSAMGLRSKTVNAATNELTTSVFPTTTSTKKHWTPKTNMHVGIAQNPMHLAEPPACQGLHIPIMWQNRPLECQMPKHFKQTEGSKQEATQTWAQGWKTKADPHC